MDSNDIITLTILLVLASAVSFIVFEIRRQCKAARIVDWADDGRCLECGYSLRGQKGNICPECGNDTKGEPSQVRLWRKMKKYGYWGF